MTTDELRLMFQRFCATENSRYAIKTPWVHGGYLWATDGHVCVRAKVEDADDVSEYKFPDATVLTWSRDKYSATATELPKATKSPWVLCEECGGDGICTHCGDGKCTACEGEGGEFRNNAIKVGGALLAERYINLLRSRGVTEIFEPVVGPIGSNARPVYFVGDWFEGLLMQRKDDAV